ncbi:MULTISPECIES: hypothetical protein [Halobacterium]|uniref:hypothetical protein n=1 Tax=Halobacterium TaxID=2239 RepID=UPI00196544AF|nr:hypothetical protein [Halobacterium sp. BOL4-2]QRY26383.1 hypothetical protein JRZ79_13110 [Halobacterium sp. BOL4-2]
MIERVKLGWRINQSVWDAFETHVAAKHGATAEYLRFELELAMREFLDEDDVLADAEALLEEYTDLQGLSSSTAAASIGTDRYRGETTLVQHRVNSELKERFQIFADKHDAGYGRLLARALDTYVDGGRARRILDDVERVITGDSTVEAQPGAEESTSTTDGGVEALGGAEENTRETRLSSDEGCASTAEADSVDVEARNVLAVVDHDDLPDDYTTTAIPEKFLYDALVDVLGTGADDVLEAYRAPVLEQLNATEHPHKPGWYVTESYREHHSLYADMDRDEREIALRRFIAEKAVESKKLEAAYTYTDVQEIFEINAGGGSPSHQYAYDLMEAAAEEPGFEYGEFHGKKQLRVDLTSVRSSIRKYVREETAFGDDLDALTANARLEDYGAGTPPETEGVADD